MQFSASSSHSPCVQMSMRACTFTAISHLDILRNLIISTTGDANEIKSRNGRLMEKGFTMTAMLLTKVAVDVIVIALVVLRLNEWRRVKWMNRDMGQRKREMFNQ